MSHDVAQSKIVVEIVARRYSMVGGNIRWDLDWGGFCATNSDFATAFVEIVDCIECSDVNKLGLAIEYRSIELDMRK